MVSTRFILRSTRVHVLVTWTRYSIADHMHLVKYTNGSARETRRPRHPDIPDTASRSHKHLLNVLGRHATSQLTEVRYTRSLSTVPQPPWGSTARVHDNMHSTQGERVLRRILPLYTLPSSQQHRHRQPSSAHPPPLPSPTPSCPTLPPPRAAMCGVHSPRRSPP